MSDAKKRWRILFGVVLVVSLAAATTALVLCYEAFQWLGELQGHQVLQESQLMQMGRGSAANGEAGAYPEDWAPGGKLAIRLTERPAALNPFLIRDAGARAVCDMVCETLAQRDLDTMEFRPSLATKWEVSDDRLTYTFHLDAKARFSDGQPVTADDVVFTFEVLRDEQICGRACAALLTDLESVLAVDPVTVRFRFARPYFLAFPAIADRYIGPKHIYALGDAKQWQEPANRDVLVGSGPLVMEKRLLALGDDIVLKRNEGYWNRSRMTGLEEVEFRIVEEDNRAFQLLKTGGLDLLYLSPEQFREAEADKNFQKFNYLFRYYCPDLGHQCVGWNTARGALSDARVRRALAMLVPRQKIVDEIYMGLARAVEAPFWSGGPQYPHDLSVTPCDGQAAALLLDDAGWKLEAKGKARQKDGRALRVELLTPKREERLKTIADFLAGEAEKAGVELKVRRLAWGEIQERVASGEFDAILLAWTASVETDPYLFWHSSQAGHGGLNLTGFSNAAADKLMESLRQQLNGAERNRMCGELAQVLAREQPCTMLLEPETLVAVSAKFAGVRRYRLGLRPQEWYIPRRPH